MRGAGMVSPFSQLIPGTTEQRLHYPEWEHGPRAPHRAPPTCWFQPPSLRNVAEDTV